MKVYVEAGAIERVVRYLQRTGVDVDVASADGSVDGMLQSITHLSAAVERAEQRRKKAAKAYSVTSGPEILRRGS